jgi:hypothetical protein
VQLGARDTYINNTCAVTGSRQPGQEDVVGGYPCSDSGLAIAVANNTYFTPHGNASIKCGGQPTALRSVQQRYGLEKGSVAGKMPSNDELLATATRMVAAWVPLVSTPQAVSAPPQAEPCTQATKQKALYLQYDFEPPLHTSPALDISVQHEWNATSDIHRYGKNGVFAAQPIGTSDGLGGYFGSQVHGDGSDGLLFSIWDTLEPHMPAANVSACLARGAPNATWCEHKHAFALSPTCTRHCLDCGLHKGWHNTTGVQCHVPMRLADGDRLVFRLRRVVPNATFSDAQQGLGLLYLGSEWELTARHVVGGDEGAASDVVVGRMFWEGTYHGISRFGAFHEHIGCCPCDAFFESEVRTGPWVSGPMPRDVQRIGFVRKQVECQKFEVVVTPGEPGSGRPASAQISTGPGTGPSVAKLPTP